MTSPTTDRRQGLVGNTPIKAPVDLATTAPITLSGEQVIDGVLTASSRVLVKDQADATQNGIYDTNSAAWTRSADADGSYDLTQGTLVYVNSGAANANTLIKLATSKPVVGSSALSWTILYSLLNLASQIGASLIGFIQAGVGAIVSTLQAKGRQIVNAKDYGALSTNTTGQNKTAVQAGITYLNSVGGGRLEIDADCNYGYKVRDLSTHPNFSGVTSDIVVIDRSAGASYVAPAKEGAQIREFFYTAQTSNALTFTAGLANGATSGTLTGNWTSTTGPWLVAFSNGDSRVVTLTNGATTATWSTGLTSSATSAATYLNPGNNDGDTHWQRSKWAPFYILSNDSAVPAVGDPSRTVTDNRRAHLGFAIDGNISFYLGIGTQAGYNYSDGEMGDFHLNRAMVSATPWVTGTTYKKDVNVTQGGLQYVCLANHVAGVFATDLANGNWIATPQETTALLIDYQTGRYNFNVDSNGFNAAYSFKERTPGVVQMILESLSANTYFLLRNSTGATQDITLQNAGGDLKVSTNFGVGVWVAVSGRTGVGVSATPNNKLEVIDSRNGQYSVAFRNNDVTAGYGLSIASGTVGTTAFSLADFYDSAGLKCAIRGNGNLVNTNNSYGAISDAKLKTNVEPAPSYWDKVKRLGKLLKTYTLIDDPSGLRLLGLIAQEAMEVSNGIVESSPDYETVELEDGTTERRLTGTSTLSVKYSVADLMQLGATAEALERIEQHDAQLEQHEATIAALVKRIDAMGARP